MTMAVTDRAVGGTARRMESVLTMDGIARPVMDTDRRTTATDRLISSIDLRTTDTDLRTADTDLQTGTIAVPATSVRNAVIRPADRNVLPSASRRRGGPGRMKPSPWCHANGDDSPASPARPMWNERPTRFLGHYSRRRFPVTTFSGARTK